VRYDEAELCTKTRRDAHPYPVNSEIMSTLACSDNVFDEDSQYLQDE